MTRYWKTTAIKDGQLVNLYTVTTERSIAIDLAAGAFGSLILATRQTRPATNLNCGDDDHIDLASGVFNHHTARHGYDGTTLSLVEVSGLPSDNLKSFMVGGTKIAGAKLHATTVFEEPMIDAPTAGEGVQQSPWRHL